MTPKEFELLAFLARHPNRVLTHHAILTAIWGPHAAAQPEHLWVLVGQLRKKLELDPAHPRYLVSEPWVGYRFMVDSESFSCPTRMSWSPSALRRSTGIGRVLSA